MKVIEGSSSEDFEEMRRVMCGDAIAMMSTLRVKFFSLSIRDTEPLRLLSLVGCN